MGTTSVTEGSKVGVTQGRPNMVGISLVLVVAVAWLLEPLVVEEDMVTVLFVVAIQPGS